MTKTLSPIEAMKNGETDFMSLGKIADWYFYFMDKRNRRLEAVMHCVFHNKLMLDQLIIEGWVPTVDNVMTTKQRDIILLYFGDRFSPTDFE